MAAAAVWSAATADSGGNPRLVLDTDLGRLTLELAADAAPRTVSRVVALAAGGAYDGSVVCESRAGGFVVLGCLPETLPGEAPKAVPSPAGWPDEIDPRALGLDRRPLGGPREIDLLWQLEIYPRYLELLERGEPVPPGLAGLIARLRAEGTAATRILLGKSRLWYLHAIGFDYPLRGSGLPVRRGSVATASVWPGEADARILIALTDLPERDGRATVYGHVASGWPALAAIAAAPVDKDHRPREPIRIRSAAPIAATAVANGTVRDPGGS
ncbi:MAG: hypothetical protein D6718_08130 [Acidobacteria bacterium]|nr:MAG: hypothetical protein D6718_08130 [Acidobacteriota bacterium]